MMPAAHDWRYVGTGCGRDVWRCPRCGGDWVEGEMEPPVCGRVSADSVVPHETPERNQKTNTYHGTRHENRMGHA